MSSDVSQLVALRYFSFFYFVLLLAKHSKVPVKVLVPLECTKLTSFAVRRRPVPSLRYTLRLLSQHPPHFCCPALVINQMPQREALLKAVWFWGFAAGRRVFRTLSTFEHRASGVPLPPEIVYSEIVYLILGGNGSSNAPNTAAISFCVQLALFVQ